MNIKDNVFLVGIIALLLGFGFGYYTGSANSSHYGKSMHSSSKMMNNTMEGMMMDLDGKTGDDLDLAFLSGMIVHHQGAVEMSQTLIKGTKRPELIKFGNDIITAQDKEIQMMKDWRKQWFNQ